MERDEELSMLCRACGMCCDGSLFGRGRLEPDETERARKTRLLVVASGTSFEQPCSALDPSRTCTVYDERPRACRAFVCRLYERHRREGGALEPRLASVRRARELVAVAQRESAASDELTKLLDDDFARA